MKLIDKSVSLTGLNNFKDISQNWLADKITYLAFYISDCNNHIIDCKKYIIDGNNITAHLLCINNCKNLIIKNLVLKNGNTEILRKIPRNSINFRNEKISIFEILDGGAVLITGNSDVIFENCEFINNNSIMCGGSISNQSTGILTLKNCKFENNCAGHTGSAIDNLRPTSNLVVENCKFINKVSNTWHIENYPHGQISIFPKSKAVISNCLFNKGSIPIDFYKNSQVKFKSNSYVGFNNWSEKVTMRSKNSIIDKLNVAKKLYWIIPKTFGNVYYSINNSKIE